MKPLDSVATSKKLLQNLSAQPITSPDRLLSATMSSRKPSSSRRALTIPQNSPNHKSPNLNPPQSISRKPRFTQHDPSSSNLRQPSTLPSSVSKQNNHSSEPTSIKPFQTPVLRKVSTSRKTSIGTQSTKTPTPSIHGSLSRRKINQKSRLPIATPTTTTTTTTQSHPLPPPHQSMSGLESLTDGSHSNKPPNSFKKSSTTQTSTSSRKSSLNGGLIDPTSLPTSSSSHQTKSPGSIRRPISRSSRIKPNSTQSIKKPLRSPPDEETKEIPDSKLVTQSIGIVLSPVVEEIPRRPMTRARSKHLLAVEPIIAPEAPIVRRRPSRVLQLAKSFEESVSGTPASTHPSPTSSNLTDLTPRRKISAASSSISTASPHSPNLIALAASLTRQHVHRDRDSRVRSSVSDMLRYSTISSLSSFRWEDGACEGLLTDEDETEAMVADISMLDTANTPVRPETEKAALALANARANFLNVAKEDEGLKMNGFNLDTVEAQDSPIKSPLVSKFPSFPRRQISSSSISTHPITPSPLSHSTHPNRLSALYGTPPASKLNGLVAQEARLAYLSEALESSRARESDLLQQLSQSQALNLSKQSHQLKQPIKAEQEREKLLVEEMERLQEEVNELNQSNIDLENDLDAVKFENEQLRLNQQTLESTLQPSCASSSPKLKITSHDEIGTKMIKVQHCQSDLRDATQTEIDIIKSQLMMLHYIKLSLALQEPLAQELDHQLT